MSTNADVANDISRRQRLTMLLLLGASFMLSVDFSILNVALPQVGTAVGLDLSGLPWVATAYAVHRAEDRARLVPHHGEAAIELVGPGSTGARASGQGRRGRLVDSCPT